MESFLFENLFAKRFSSSPKNFLIIAQVKGGTIFSTFARTQMLIVSIGARFRAPADLSPCYALLTVPITYRNRINYNLADQLEIKYKPVGTGVPDGPFIQT